MAWPSTEAHVRLAEFVSTSSSTWRSVHLFPQEQWQSRTTEKPASNEPAYCESQDFEHNYALAVGAGKVKVELHLNHFKRTKAGEFSTMRDLCLDAKGLPLRRLCNATGQWEKVKNVTCLAGNQLSRQLNHLSEQLLGEMSHKPVVLTKLRYLLSEAHGKLAAVDIYSTAKIFAKLAERKDKESVLGADLVSICREIMSSDAKVLRLSAQLNATNSLLSKFEDYMNALPQQFVSRESCGKATTDTSLTTNNDVETIKLANIGVQALMSSNLSVFYVNPFCENITGIAIYSTSNSDRRTSISGFYYRFLYANENLEKLRREANLEAASYLPEQLWHQLKERGATYLILKVYAHDGLFVETAQVRSRRPRSKVLSITIPGFEGVELPSALPFLLPQGKYSNGESGCGYWNYGSWLNDGVTTCQEENAQWAPNVLCQAHHLTQFTFLVGGSYAQLHVEDKQLQLESALPAHEELLDMITLVGCGLSLFGLVCIFLTAALVKKWRNQASTKVLLHLCLALSLQLLLFGYLGENLVWSEDDWNRCLILGALLQYSVLVIFSWMLIIAFLQFQRYVTVIGVARPNHYILISAIVAWTLPLLPVLMVVLFDAESFKPSDYQRNSHSALCYPSGYGLALGVVLPIAMVTIANAFMMLCIIYSIHRALNPRRQLIIQQLRLSVLLFFLLGLTWIFGLCSYMHLGIVFSYLFCLTATLQGFVLFVYFVLLNTTNRRAWLNLICPNQTKINVPKRTMEQNSMTTSLSNSYRITQT
ncbi:GH14343 [Drosophila grimshawi]|uniref:GH14343 n=2 Tax=Drosophila grimshawi TaxID=7222 RepID=B4JYQ2_DROGR|nr:GH14343 [Drosophila grimshawi]